MRIRMFFYIVLLFALSFGTAGCYIFAGASLNPVDRIVRLLGGYDPGIYHSHGGQNSWVMVGMYDPTKDGSPDGRLTTETRRTNTPVQIYEAEYFLVRPLIPDGYTFQGVSWSDCPQGRSTRVTNSDSYGYTFTVNRDGRLGRHAIEILVIAVNCHTGQHLESRYNIEVDFRLDTTCCGHKYYR